MEDVKLDFVEVTRLKQGEVVCIYAGFYHTYK